MILLAQVAAFIAGVAGFVVALGLLAQSRYVGKPLRWLWRTNVSEPVGRWNHGIIANVVDERIEHLMHNRNGGSSLLDLAEALRKVEGSVETLLEHDDERDTAGLRYGPNDEGGRA